MPPGQILTSQTVHWTRPQNSPTSCGKCHGLEGGKQRRKESRGKTGFGGEKKDFWWDVWSVNRTGVEVCAWAGISWRKTQDYLKEWEKKTHKKESSHCPTLCVPNVKVSTHHFENWEFQKKRKKESLSASISTAINLPLADSVCRNQELWLWRK